jgi:DNA repair exonuclease SbcCD ATPase subunit
LESDKFKEYEKRIRSLENEMFSRRIHEEREQLLGANQEVSELERRVSAQAKKLRQLRALVAEEFEEAERFPARNEAEALNERIRDLESKRIKTLEQRVRDKNQELARLKLLLEALPDEPTERQESTPYVPDAFIQTLTAKEQKEFCELFIPNANAIHPYLPAYKIGGDNKVFFDRVFIYLGLYRDRISQSLLEKMHLFVNKLCYGGQSEPAQGAGSRTDASARNAADGDQYDGNEKIIHFANGRRAE